jgi:hypothetical protein
MEPIVWIIGGGTAAYLLLSGKDEKPPAPIEKAEEISQEAANMVDEIIVQEEENGNGNGEDEPGYDLSKDVNQDGFVNVRDIVAQVNQSVSDFTNGNGTLTTPGLEEMSEDQQDLFESLSTQRGCIRLYEDQEIPPETEAVYSLLETEKGWKVKHKPLQEGSLEMRDYLCPPGREPLQW